MEFKKFMEALKGNQHKLDKNKNGKLDAHDFKLLRQEEDECEYEDENEKNEKEMDEAVERVARADYKQSPSGRKTHKEITFKDGSPEEDESKKVSEEVDLKEGITKVYHKFMAKRAGKKSDHAYDMGDEKEFQKQVDNTEYHRVKAGGRPTRINTDPDAKMLTTRAPRKEEVELEERTMTDAEMKKREEIVKGMKKNIAGFKDKYGDRAKEVMYATATKMAMKEETIEEAAGQHKVMVTVSDPNHTTVSQRKEQIMKRVIVNAETKEHAVEKAKQFYKKKGYKVHDAEYHSAQPKSTMKTEEALAEEQLDERNKENATRRKMMDASRGARYKTAGNPVPDREPQHKTAQAHNKAIGRALRNEDTDLEESVKPGETHHIDWDGRSHVYVNKVEGDKVHLTRLNRPIHKDKSQPVRPEDKIIMSKKEFHSSKLKEEIEIEEQVAVAPVPGQKWKSHAIMVNGRQRVVIDRKHVKNYPEHEGWKEVAPGQKVKKEDVDFDEEGNLMAEKLSFSDFLAKINEQLLEYETKGGVYRHKGSYGSSYQGDDDDDEDGPKKKPAEPAVKRGRGRPAGSKSGANQKVGSGKSYGGIAHHTLNLPTSK